jgi:type II secretory ATPase GspE/PulE/Tfp pilus assembly ATPase PilB-like protein
LEVVVAQRLVRLICKHCKEEVPTKEVERLQRQFGDVVPAVMSRGRGCRQCMGTGYRGRTGIFEMMPISDPIRSLILNRSASHDIRKVAVREGMASLREDGWRLIGEGRTTVDEVMRNTKDETGLHKYGMAEEAAPELTRSEA